MYLSDYTDVLSNQCTNCSLFLTIEDTKLTNINNPNCTNVLTDDNSPGQLSNTEALSYIYGLSIRSLTEKLKSYFVKHEYGRENEQNNSEQIGMSGGFDENVAVLCGKCGPVLEELYRVSKHFRNLSDKNSFVWKILEERGFGADLEENEKESSDIKQEYCNESNEDPLISNVEDFSNLEHWNDDFDNNNSDPENEFEDIKPETSFENENSEDTDEKSLPSPQSNFVKTRSRKRKQDLFQREILDSTDELSVGNNTKRRKCRVYIGKEDEQEMGLESSMENSLIGKLSPPVSEASDQKDDELIIFNTNDKEKGTERRYCSRGTFSKSVDELKNHYEEVVWKEGSSTERVKYKFKCKECGIPFISLKVMNRHFLSQHFKKPLVHTETIEGPPYQCPKCDKTYQQFRSLQRHCADIHDFKLAPGKKSRKSKTDILPVASELEVRKSQSDNEIKKQVQTPRKGNKNKMNGQDKVPTDPIQYSDEELYFCRECNVSFDLRTAFNIHRHRSHDNHQYDCRHCENNFVYLSSFLNHLAEVHKIYARPQEYLDQYICKETNCKSVGYRYEWYKIHQKEANHKMFTIICAFCEESFTDIKSLKVHKRKNHKELKWTKKNCAKYGFKKLYSCRFCDRTFESYTLLIEHRATHPEEERTFKCTTCNLIFPDYYKFAVHKVSHRDADKSFVCPTCGWKLNGLKQFHQHCKRHAERESGVRAVCEICGKSFITKRQLHKHRNTIHLRKEEKTCHLCGHVSKSGYNMKLHLKVHEKNGILRRRKNADIPQ